MSTIPELIVKVGKLIFDRGWTDIAGGNISVRDGERVFFTPTGAGQFFLWDLKPEQILCAPIATDELLNHPLHSKESISHLMLYRAFPEVGAVIHAHPFHLMPFAAAGKPPRPLTLTAKMYGEIACLGDAPLYSAQQGQLMVEAMAPKRELMAVRAYAVLMPLHGIIIAGKDLFTTLDCLERMDNSAYCNLMMRLVD